MEGIELKILIPYKVFETVENVSKVVINTNEGSLGILPHRLDCVTEIVPGLLTYQTHDGKENYLALDEGILIKKGNEVLISSHDAIGGADLGKLHELVEKEFMNLDDQEKEVRIALAKLESGFIRAFEKFRK